MIVHVKKLQYWLVVSTPLKNMSSSVGMMNFPIYGKIKHVPVATNQMFTCKTDEQINLIELLSGNPTWLAGKSLINGPFSIAMFDCQRVIPFNSRMSLPMVGQDENSHLDHVPSGNDERSYSTWPSRNSVFSHSHGGFP